MLNEKVAALCNEQINKEFYSAYLYLDIANYYADQGLDGFANWYTIQAQEERDHAILFLQYLQNNGERVTLEAIAKPDKEFNCHRCALEVGYEHEQYVTSLINTIYEAAMRPRTSASMQFLDWSSRSRARKRRTPMTCSRSMTCTAPIPRVCIRSTASWLRGSILRRR